MTPFVLLIAVAIADIALSGRWNSAYFRFGVPIFWSTANVRGLRADIDLILQTTFSGRAAPPLAFKRLSADEIAFREKAWGFSWFNYTPVMHGLLRYVPEEGKVHVIGWINWFVPAFVSFFVWSFKDHFEWTFLIFLGALLALIYAIQAYRFTAVRKRVQQSAA